MSLESVYREHFRFVWRSLARLGVPQADLADAVQDVFLVVHKKLATFEGRSRISTWLYAICLRVASDRRRAAHRREEAPSSSVFEVAASDDSPSQSVEERERREQLDAILDTLPLEQRAVFTLFELDEMRCEDIAQLLEIPLGTVYSRLRLGREAFRRAAARFAAREQSRVNITRGEG